MITMHRALTRFVLEPSDLITAGLLVVLFTFAWILSLPWLCRMWRYVFTEGIRLLALGSAVGVREHFATPYIRFLVPYPRMEGISPDAETWWITAAVVGVGFAATFFLPKKFTPVTYLLRAVLFIQVTALVYFAWIPAKFPHTPDSYMEGMVTYGIALISIVPTLFGLTYYIFRFRLIRKAALTAMTMAHLAVFFPLQILAQAVLLEKSVLFMPVLYIVFGLPVDVMIILAFYSWGMSWPSKTQNEM
ncbi:MAG TPA: hypothetical protein VEJ46_08615 [Candidatus Acidoferrum sp.]|nr:hypothetical protein [Candidatus Acidoferrum sp.]